jgi:hypothetical protein
MGRFVLLDRKEAFALRAAAKSLRLACAESEVLCQPSGVLAVLSRSEKEKNADRIAAANELAGRFEKKLEQLAEDQLTYNSVRTRPPRTVPPPAHSTCRVRGRLGLAAAHPTRADAPVGSRGLVRSAGRSMRTRCLRLLRV